MPAGIDERNTALLEREVPDRDVRLENIKNTVSAVINDSKLDESKGRELNEQVEKFALNPGEMPRQEYSSMVVSLMVLGDKRSDDIVSEIIRERSDCEGRNITGKDESLLEDKSCITMDAEARQTALSRNEERGKSQYTPPELPILKSTAVREMSPNIEKNRDEARNTAIADGSRILNEIRDEQRDLIKDYVKEYHGGLSDPEQERLSDKILKGYIERDDKNSVTDSLKEDITKLSSVLNDVAFSRNEDIKSVLDFCSDRQQGNIREFVPSDFNMSPRAGESNRFTEMYSELKGLLPVPERAFYSEARMAAGMRDDVLKEALNASLSEIGDLRTSDLYNRDKADRAADAVQEIMFENRMPSAVLNELLAREIPDAALGVSILEKQPDADDIDQRLELAHEKLAVVLNPKFDSSITNYERQEVISKSSSEILSCEREMVQNGSLDLNDELKLKHELLEELVRDSDLYKGTLNESLHNLNYTVDLKNSPVVEKLINEKLEERDASRQEARDNLERLISEAKEPDESLRTQIASKDALDAERENAAMAYEKAYFSDPVTAYSLAIAMRDAMAGDRLSKSQNDTLNEAREVCDLLNEARDDDKQLKDYYPSLEWDTKNNDRFQTFINHADLIDRDEVMDKLQAENSALYEELYSDMKNDLRIANSKYDECLSEIEKIEKRGSSLSERTYEKLSDLKTSLNGLKNDILDRSQKLNEFSADFARSLPENDSRYDDTRAALSFEREDILSDAMHRTGTKLEAPLLNNTFTADSYGLASDFNLRCQGIKARDEALAPEKISKLLERPVLTKEQQDRFEKASAMRDTLMRERQDAIERVRSTFSKYDLERMDEALAHNVPCSVPGFNDYASRLEQAKTECERNMAQLSSGIKDIYVNRYNEISNTLDKLEGGRASILNYSRSSDLSRSEKKELALYQQLADEEKAIGDMIAAKFGDENYRMENVRYEKALSDDMFDSKNLSFSSEADARFMLKKAVDVLSSDALEYDKCKSIAIEKDSKGSVDDRFQDVLDRRAAAERAADSAFQYLVRTDNYTSADSRMYENTRFIYDPVRSYNKDGDRLVISKEIKREIDSRTESINPKEIASKQAEVLDRAREAKHKPFILSGLKEDPEIRTRDIKDRIDRDDEREEQIKTTMFSKISDSWAMIREGNSKAIFSNMLYSWADKLSPRETDTPEE